MTATPRVCDLDLDPKLLLLAHDPRGILRLTLNDNKRRNALSEEMIATLNQALLGAESDPSVRVIILTANGPAYSSGHDLKQITAQRSAADQGREYFTALLERCAALMQQIVEHPKPIIAEVNGVATAAGCQLVASCDLAVAAETARFSTPGVHIGLFCSTPMVALSRNVSRKAAMEMLLTGEMITADRAEAIGLVNKVTSAENLTETSMAMAATIASKSSMTLSTGKKAFYQQLELSLADAYRHSAEVMVNNMLKADAIEGISAFIEKRPAAWTDQ